MEEEHDYGKRKAKPDDCKDDVLYGIFYKEGSTKKKRRKDLSTKPLTFVSSGIDHNRKDDQGVDFLDSEGALERSRLHKKSSSNLRLENDVGVFEKQTKGIGMKLLEKMGYKGGGLGKNAQGIVTPIQPKLRPKNMGMGFNDYKEAANLQEPFEEIKVFPLANHGIQQKEKTWSTKDSKGVLKKKGKQYVTIEKLLIKKQEQGLNIVQKVFDMRGPQVRVLTNLKNLKNTEEEEEEEKSNPMKELQHNIRLLVDLARLDKQKLERELTNEIEIVVTLQKEKMKLKDDATRQKKQLESLLEAMHEFQVNAADQNKVDQFDWVNIWASEIPIHHKLHIMDVYFNKWLQDLYQWLHSNPNFQEVINWYLGWKELIPLEILSNEHVRYWLNIGLDMMNQASEGLEVVHPGLRENVSHFKTCEQRQFEGSFGRDEMSLKEVIEVHAQDNDLVFKPKVGRMKDGHQVYGFGKISVIIDSLNQKVFAQTQDSWSLVTLEQLVEMEKRLEISR